MAVGHDNALKKITASYPCRDDQVKQLAALLSPRCPRPSNIIVHGAESTGKSAITSEIAAASCETATIIIKCEECITARHLLERTTASCFDAAAALAVDQLDRRAFARCENVSALCAHLQDLRPWLGPSILVLDGIDRLLDGSPALLPSLARVAETVPQLTVVYVLNLPGPRTFHLPGIPSVYFPAYTRTDTLQILSREPRPIYPISFDAHPLADGQEQREDDLYLWTRFCAAVWDSLAMTAARDLVSFRALTEKLWPLFTAPVLAGQVSCRDFSRLMVTNRSIFQSDDCLTDGVHLKDTEARQPQDTQHMSPVSKYLICAAYLASYNPARQDQIFFMEMSDRRKKRRGGAARGRPPTHRKIPRKALPPALFTLQRLHAIFSAIYPTPVGQLQSTDILTIIASLTSARLLLRSGGGGTLGDPLDERAKWRVNISWDHAVKLGRSIGFEIQDWSAD